MSNVHLIMVIASAAVTWSGYNDKLCTIAWMATAIFAHVRVLRYIKNFGSIKYD